MTHTHSCSLQKTRTKTHTRTCEFRQKTGFSSGVNGVYSWVDTGIRKTGTSSWSVFKDKCEILRPVSLHSFALPPYQTKCYWSVQAGRLGQHVTSQYTAQSLYQHWAQTAQHARITHPVSACTESREKKIRGHWEVNAERDNRRVSNERKWAAKKKDKAW